MLENRAISEKRTVNENSLSGPPNPIEIGENSDFSFFIESRIKPNTRGCFAFGENISKVSSASQLGIEERRQRIIAHAFREYGTIRRLCPPLADGQSHY